MLGHGNRVQAAARLVGDKDDWLVRPGENEAHLVAIGSALVDVRGEEHGHHEVETWERIDKPNGVPYVAEQRCAKGAIAMVEDARTVGAGTVIGARAVEHQGRLTATIADRHGARSALVRPLDQ